MTYINRVFGAFLLCCGTRMDLLVELDFVTEAEAEMSRTNTRKRQSLSTSQRAIKVEPAFILAITRHVQIESDTMKNACARFLYTLLVVPSPYIDVSAIIRPSAQALCACAYRFFGPETK